MPTPIPYDEEIADQVCDAIATSKRGLEQIIRDLDLAISPSLIYKWLQQNEAFRERYTRAKEDQLQILEDEMLTIADTTEVGEIITDKGDKVEVKRGDMLEHRKLKIETRKWLMGKLKPKKYGDKIQQEHSGEVGIKTVIVTPDAKKPKPKPEIKPDFAKE